MVIMEPERNGQKPIRQWAITPVTAARGVGSVPIMAETWQKRLEDAMREKGFSMKSLSIAAGLNETFVRDALKRNRRPSIANFGKLAAKLGTSPGALMGEEETAELSYVPFEGDDPEWKPFSDLPPDNGFAVTLSGAVYERKLPGALPELDVATGAGEGQVGEVVALQVGDQTISAHRVVDEWVLPEGYLRNEIRASPNFTIVMPVVGDSMSPTYHPGDRVIVDTTQRELRADTVYVISDGFSPPQIKRLQRVLFTDPVQVRIISDNPAFVTDTVELSRVVIMGRVVAHMARK